MKLLVLGYSGTGKSLAAEILAQALNTDYLNTSDQLVIELAESIDVSTSHILENKDLYRMRLFKFGRAKQEQNPLWPQDVQITKADILTGLRSPDEVVAARKHNLYDKIIWIDRKDYGPGVTDKLTPEHADVIIKNDGGIEDLKEKLRSLLDQLRQELSSQPVSS
jgi:hypothetical protein